MDATRGTLSPLDPMGAALSSRALNLDPLSLLKYTSTSPAQCHGNRFFPECLAPRVQLGQLAAPHCRVLMPGQTLARQGLYSCAFGKKADHKIVGNCRDTGFSAKDDCAARKEFLALARGRKSAVMPVTGLACCGRSMLGLFHALRDQQASGVSVVDQTALQPDMCAVLGDRFASPMAALAALERDLLRERSGIAAAKQRGCLFGRHSGQRENADRFAPRTPKLAGEGRSYRESSHRWAPSRNAVFGIVKRDHAARDLASPRQLRP
jgi:putative DNA-invertase from lambdoid prophage Rac